MVHLVEIGIVIHRLVVFLSQAADRVSVSTHRFACCSRVSVSVHCRKKEAVVQEGALLGALDIPLQRPSSSHIKFETWFGILVSLKIGYNSGEKWHW